MSSGMPPSEQYQIAALDRRTAVVAADVMAAGAGTPWEDRGALGTVAAFFKTVGMSLFQPAKLLEQMRRPETSSDVTAFAAGCGLMWAMSVVIHSAIAYSAISKDADAGKVDLSASQYWLNTGLQAAGAWVGTLLLLKIASGIYLKLVAHDMKQRTPSVLIYNAMGYGLGPSILALVPFVGPPVALVWIFVNWLVMGFKRLRVKPGAAVVTAVLTFVAVGALVGGVYLGGQFLASNVLGWDSHPPIEHHRDTPILG